MVKKRVPKPPLKFGKQFEPFIRHIRFPHYKNLAADTRIEFSHPITALVGANGTNKSSILRAVQGCPGRNNLGNFWFSTANDSIVETKESKNCFIYAYEHNAAAKTVEVLKTRVDNKDDPDYWEPSRPIRRYQMEPFVPIKGNTAKTRWDPVQKPTVYIDFRNSLSAFDKFFYQSDEQADSSSKDKKNFIRKRSKALQFAIKKRLESHNYYRIERIINKTNKILPDNYVAEISKIIGKVYDEIHWIHHKYFNVEGYTAVMRSKGLKYTEAFAGSGEFAIVKLVVEVLEAPKGSLILLDEPEVSLHPGAQEKLIEFLTDQCRTRHHQVVFSTHSPALIRHLPRDAIKVFVAEGTTGKIQMPSQEAAPEEAFFHIGSLSYDRISVVVEDILAQELLRKVFRQKGQAFASQYELKKLPGGAASVWTHNIPSFVVEDRKDILILFDADQANKLSIPDPGSYGPSKYKELQHDIENIVGGSLKFLIDGGDGGANTQQLEQFLRDYCVWVKKNVRVLPNLGSPEDFIWKNMSCDKLSKSCDSLDSKANFAQLARLELGRTADEPVSSTDIFQTQARRLMTIDDDNPYFGELRSILEAFATNRNCTKL